MAIVILLPATFTYEKIPARENPGATNKQFIWTIYAVVANPSAMPVFLSTNRLVPGQ